MIKLLKGTSPTANSLQMGDVSLMFSYETLIGVSTPDGTWRRANEWGPTTGKHFSQFGLKNADVVDADELEAIAKRAMHIYSTDLARAA